MNPTLPSGMQEEADKMKGDAIGDTMYSERWVLKTLIKLSEKYMDYTSADDYRLESDLEGDLGLLWDMTIEPDVAKYLMDHNALDLIVDILKFSGSPRLIEIMIGILGNLACEEGVRLKISSNEGLIKIIINLLTFTDSPTLLQLVRLLTTCIWDTGKKVKKAIEGRCGGDEVDEVLDGTASLWISCLQEESELIYRSINFILASSRNGELLTATLGLLESLFNLTWYANDHFCKHFSTEESIKALLEALKEVTCHVEDVADSHLNHRRVKDACAHWITVVHRMTYHQLGTNALREHADAVFDLVSSLWVEQSVSKVISCSALHMTLAVELLEALLPLTSRPCAIASPALALLEVEEWEGDEEEGVVAGLRQTLEDFCVSVVRQWASRGVVAGELTSLKGGPEGRLDALEGLVAKRLGGGAAATAGTSSEDCSELGEVMRIIKEVKVS